MKRYFLQYVNYQMCWGQKYFKYPNMGMHCALCILQCGSLFIFQMMTMLQSFSVKQNVQCSFNAFTFFVKL